MIARLFLMRILILTPRLPWPPLDGGRVAMARLAESLARCGAEVEVLSLNPRKHRGVAQGPVPVAAVDIDTSRVVGPAFSRTAPYVVARFVSRAFDEALRAVLRRFAPDVVQIESPFLLPYAASVRAESGARIVLRSLNVEFRIWEGLARLERNPLRRLALRRIASSLRRYEMRAMEDLDAVVPISAADAADFRRLGCTRPMHVVPCGMPLPALGDAPAPLRVGFLGALDYRPNRQAVRWIREELWPRVTARMPEAELVIAGSAHGTQVVDAHAFVRGLSVFIAPLFAGGGMRIKVLEAMALGKPIVANALGAGGIDVRHDRDILLADDVESFADAVVRLLREPETAARLGAAARATVAERYDGDALARGLLTFYESL